MIDFGATALSALRKCGREPNEIQGFLFTHLHGDHIGGFPYLLIDGMFNQLRTAPLDVLGPVNTQSKLSELSAVAYGSVVDREKPFTWQVQELQPDQEARFHGAQVQGFAADHMDPPEKPLCLRVALPEGPVVAFSGDTMMCDGLRAAAKGADVLVAECSGMRHPIGRHCAWDDWMEALPSIGAKRVILTHLNSEVRTQIPELLQSAPSGCALSFAEDGMVIPL